MFKSYHAFGNVSRPTYTSGYPHPCCYQASLSTALYSDVSSSQYFYEDRNHWISPLSSDRKDTFTLPPTVHLFRSNLSPGVARSLNSVLSSYLCNHILTLALIPGLSIAGMSWRISVPVYSSTICRRSPSNMDFTIHGLKLLHGHDPSLWPHPLPNIHPTLPRPHFPLGHWKTYAVLKYQAPDLPPGSPRRVPSSHLSSHHTLFPSLCQQSLQRSSICHHHSE